MLLFQIAVIVGTIESSQLISAALLSPIRLGQPDIIAYSISVESVKKGDQHQALWSSENTLRINTTATENSCGVPGLTVGQQYVLSGKSPFIHSSDFHLCVLDVKPRTLRKVNLTSVLPSPKTQWREHK